MRGHSRSHDERKPYSLPLLWLSLASRASNSCTRAANNARSSRACSYPARRRAFSAFSAAFSSSSVIRPYYAYTASPPKQSPFGDSGGAVGIRAPGPPPGTAPAHPVAPEDAPPLAARHLDAARVGGVRQRSERPLGLRVGIGCLQLAGPFVGRLAGGGPLHQRADRAALTLGEPWRATRTGLDAQAVDSPVSEGLPPFAHRLRVAAECLAGLARPQTVPTADHQLGVQDPIGRRRGTGGHFAHPARVGGVDVSERGTVLRQ